MDLQTWREQTNRGSRKLKLEQLVDIYRECFEVNAKYKRKIGSLLIVQPIDFRTDDGRIYFHWRTETTHDAYICQLDKKTNKDVLLRSKQEDRLQLEWICFFPKGTTAEEIYQSTGIRLVES
jgi:hypothetical protein